MCSANINRRSPWVWAAACAVGAFSIAAVMAADPVTERASPDQSPAAASAPDTTGQPAGSALSIQAALRARAQQRLTYALRTLDELKPLPRGVDRASFEVARRLVRAELVALVDELGARGGPRVERMDDYFERLHVRLSQLEALLKPRPGAPRTVEEEQNFTHVVQLRDYIVALEHDWLANRQRFLPPGFRPSPPGR